MAKELDSNNRKALGIASLTLKALENGLEEIDVECSLEVVCDYLKSNDHIFDERSGF